MERKLLTAQQQDRVRPGFTLVELLVVITIIGILAALITAAGAGALKSARRARIKTEIDQISMGLQTFKDTYQSYPPNCQVDDTSDPLNETQVLTDIKRAFKQAFPRHREPDSLIAQLVGLNPNGTVNTTNALKGGMSSGEALVFWLGGFSSDPKYPISGEGGPSYQIDSDVLDGVTAVQADPIANRKWVFPFEVARLRPRTDDNFFDDGDDRFITYTVTIPGQYNNAQQTRRINFWQYVPAQSEQPYLYFDTSRHAPGEPSGSNNLLGTYDPPAATELNPNELHVHAIKTRSESANDAVKIQFANKDKFQILHAGIDEEWGNAAFEQMSVHDIGTNTATDYLLFPDGPFTGEIADTITNFSEGTLEASQPQ